MAVESLQMVLGSIALALPGCLDECLTIGGLTLWDYDPEVSSTEGDTVYVTPEVLSAEAGAFLHQEPPPVLLRLKKATAEFSLPSSVIAISIPTSVYKYIEDAVAALTDPIERDVVALFGDFPLQLSGDYNAVIERADKQLFDNHAPQDGSIQAAITDAQYEDLLALYPDLDRTGLAGPFNVYVPAPEHQTGMKCGAAFHRNALCLTTRRPRAVPTGVNGHVMHDGFYCAINVRPSADQRGIDGTLTVLYSAAVLDPDLGAGIALTRSGQAAA